MRRGNRTATYKYSADSGGRRYSFYCDVSGAIVCSTEPIKLKTLDEELQMAWKMTGENCFNRCRKCGRWVIDSLYNPEKLECVVCSPWETDLEIRKEQENVRDEFGFGPGVMKKKKVCSYCKTVCNTEGNFCHICGTILPAKTLYDIYGEPKKDKKRKGKRIWDYLVKKHVYFVEQR